MVIPDSIMYPAESDSTYPYTDDGNREFLEGKPFIEPFTLIPSLRPSPRSSASPPSW